MTTGNRDNAGGGLDAILETFLEGTGARMAALVDKSGGVCAHSGFGAGRPVEDVAGLAAGLHASSRRITEIARSGPLLGMMAWGRDGQLVVSDLGEPRASWLLVSVFEGTPPGPESVSEGVERVRAALEGAPAPGAEDTLTEPLLERVDRTFTSG